MGQYRSSGRTRSNWTPILSEWSFTSPQTKYRTESRYIPIFLNVVGSTTYRLLHSHFQPNRNVMAERFRFHGRNQMAGESVAQFVAELQRLAALCEFGECLTEALRDHLVCGLRSEPAQRKLLGEGGALTLQRAIELVQTMESAKD